MKCQVVEPSEQWPFQLPCDKTATNQVQLWVRQNYPHIQEEYVCTNHAVNAVKAFGETSVVKLPKKEEE